MGDGVATITRDEVRWQAGEASWLSAWIRRRGGLAVLLIGVGGFNWLTLLRRPAPFVDEAWNASRALGLLRTGRAFGDLDAGVFERFDGYWTYFPWLGTAIHASAIWAFGLSLFSVRLVSLVFGLALLVAVFAIGNRLGGVRQGLTVVLLTALSQAYLLTSHLARHDIIVAALGFGAVALYFTDEARGFSIKSVLSGLTVGLALDIHPNAVIFGPTVAALYLLDHGWAFLREKRFWGFVAGGMAGVAYFAAIHVLPYPRTYALLSSTFAGAWHQPPLFTLNPGVWLESFLRLLGLIAWGEDFRILLLVGAILLVLLRRSSSDRRQLVLFGALFFSFAAIILFKQTWYVILVSPAADLLIANLLIGIAELRARALLWSILAWLVVLGSAVYTVPRLITSDAMLDFTATLSQVRAAIPPGKTVMGLQEYWWGLQGQPYLSWEQLSYYQHFTPGTGLADAFQALRPDYLVLDQRIVVAVADNPKEVRQFFQFLFEPKSDLDRFLSQHARLVSTFHSTIYGDVRIYRIDWSRGSDGG